MVELLRLTALGDDIVGWAALESCTRSPRFELKRPIFDLPGHPHLNPVAFRAAEAYV